MHNAVLRPSARTALLSRSAPTVHLGMGLYHVLISSVVCVMGLSGQDACLEQMQSSAVYLVSCFQKSVTATFIAVLT